MSACRGDQVFERTQLRIAGLAAEEDRLEQDVRRGEVSQDLQIGTLTHHAPESVSTLASHAGQDDAAYGIGEVGIVIHLGDQPAQPPSVAY